MQLEMDRRVGASIARRRPTKAARAARQRYELAQREECSAEIRACHLAFIGGITSTLAAKGLCLRCGKTLTDPVSIARQIGPDCLHKVGGDEGWAHYREAIGLGGAS